MGESRIFVFPFSLAEFDLLHLEKNLQSSIVNLGEHVSQCDAYMF